MKVNIFICSKTGNRQIQFITQHFSRLDHLHSTATIFIISGYCLYYDYLTALFESTYLFHLNILQENFISAYAVMFMLKYKVF